MKNMKYTFSILMILASTFYSKYTIAQSRDWRNVNNVKGVIPHENYVCQEYVVVAKNGDWVTVVTTGPGGESHAGQPIGSGPGKGCIDLVACKNTRITGCKISALGDAMHIHSCHNNIFSNNQILGARMGAFFLAEYSKNSSIVGNTVNGTNGSRIISIERSNEDVTVIGNTFRNGGRGSWINQPKNLIMQGNIFINNTTKCDPGPWIGRKTFKTGTWESYSEIYFTTYQKGGKYGPVILKDNIFETGPGAAAAIQFEKNGEDVLVEGNFFKGNTGIINLDADDKTITIGKNFGAKVMESKDGGKSKYRNE